MTAYNPKNFLRKAPRDLLLRYFEQKQAFNQNLYLEKVKDDEYKALYDAWGLIEEDKRNEMEGDFQEILLLACEGGLKNLMENSPPSDQDFLKELEERSGFLEKVFWIFLERPQYWKKGALFLMTDRIGSSRWMEWQIERLMPAKSDDISIKMLERNLSGYFHEKEGRGQNCQVEYYKRGDLDYYFAYPENYSQSITEWVQKKLEKKNHTPAFEIIFVYSQKLQKISLCMTGGRDTKENIARIFKDAIISAKENSLLEVKTVYAIDAFKSQGFQLKFEPSTGIESIVVRKLKFNIPATSESITIESKSKTDQNAIYDLKEKVTKDLPASSLKLQQVGVYVTFKRDPNETRKKPRTRYFEISPKSNSLKHEGQDAILRQVLFNSGVETIVPKE